MGVWVSLVLNFGFEFKADFGFEFGSEAEYDFEFKGGATRCLIYLKP